MAEEFDRVPLTVHGVHLLVLQAGTVTQEHRERPTEHCGLLFALRGEAIVRLAQASCELKPGKAVHCAYGRKLEIRVGAEEFEGILIQYLPNKGPEMLHSLRYMPTDFELEPGEDEGLFGLLRLLCLVSRQPMPVSTASVRIGKLQQRILKETFRLSGLHSKAKTGTAERRHQADITIESLSDLFNKTAFIVEDVIRMTLSPGSRLGEYRLSKNGFLFAVRGQAIIRFREKEYGLEPGVVCHGPEGEQIVLTQRGGEEFEYYLIHYRFCGQHEAEAWAEEMPGDFVLRPGMQPRIMELLERLHQTAAMPGKLANLRRKELFLSILGEAFVACQSGLFSPRQLEAVERAIGYIHTHYAEPLTLEHLARLQGMSARQFSYLFHKNIGMRPIDYVIQYRIRRAREILATAGQQPIGEVAALVGYDDPQYFSRVFKRHTGMSPREARLPRTTTGVDNHPSFIE